VALLPVAQLSTGCAGRLASHGERWVVAEAACAQLHHGFTDAAFRSLPAGLGQAAAFDAAGEHVLVDFWRVPVDGGEPVAVPQFPLSGGPGGGYDTRALAWAPDGSELVAVAIAVPLLLPSAPPADGWRLAVLDPETGAIRARAEGSGDGGPQRVACTAGAVVSANAAAVTVYDRELQPLDQVPETRDTQALAAGGAIAASVTAAGELVLIDLAAARVTARVAAHDARGTAVAVAPDGAWIATGSESGEVRAFAPDGGPIGEASAGARVEACSAGADGLLLASHIDGVERGVHAWRAAPAA
jgi:hypothetical protein